jgi:hypothetical protein
MEGNIKIYTPETGDKLCFSQLPSTNLGSIECEVECCRLSETDVTLTALSLLLAAFSSVPMPFMALLSALASASASKWFHLMMDGFASCEAAIVFSLLRVYTEVGE